MFSPDLVRAAQEHARQVFPQESVGFVVDGQYLPQINIAEDPTKAFKVATTSWPLNGAMEAVIHSHPDGELRPSREDMAGQIASAVPWGLMTVQAESVSDLLWWGPGVEIPELVGRPYRSGPSGSDGKGDCYALIKDWYFVRRGVVLDEFPREEDDFIEGRDLYRDNFESQGFYPIPAHDLKPGDCCLMQIRTKVPNHAAIYLGNGVGLHHLQGKLSRTDNLGRYKSFITTWLRHESTR